MMAASSPPSDSFPRPPTSADSDCSQLSISLLEPFDSSSSALFATPNSSFSPFGSTKSLSPGMFRRSTTPADRHPLPLPISPSLSTANIAQQLGTAAAGGRKSPFVRNNSSGSLANSPSAAAILQQQSKLMSSYGGSTSTLPNGGAGGIQHGQHQQTFPPLAKRSFPGTGTREATLLHQQLFPLLPAGQQQQFQRPSLYATALNNSVNEYFLQQQHQAGGGTDQSQRANSNPPPPLARMMAISPSCVQHHLPSATNSTALAVESQQPPSNFSNGSNSGGCGGGAGTTSSGASVAGCESATGGGITLGTPKAKLSKDARIKSWGGFSPDHLEPLHKHRGELSIHEKYRYDLSRAQLKASSRTSALLSGFAMIALVELQYMPDTPKPLLIMLGVVTTLLVSVHLLALMMSTCLLPYIEANGCTQDSPHIKLKFYIELSWLFSTCIGLLLFLLEIGVIFFVKFNAINYNFAAYITTGILVPVLIIFIVISYLIHRNRFSHSIERVNDKVIDLQRYIYGEEGHGPGLGPPPQTNSIQRNVVNAGLQGVTVVRNFKHQ